MNTEPVRIAILPAISGYDIRKRVYSPDGIAPTILTCVSGDTGPKILVKGGSE